MGSDDQSCFQYTLRVAYLEARIRQTTQEIRRKVASPPVGNAIAGSSRRSQDGTSSFFAFDLSSLVGRDSAKSPRFPERMLKVLDGTLQRIAMGQEPKYTNQRFRRTIARFWSAPWADKSIQRQLKESRKVEEIILAFVSSATKTLQKDDELAEGAWKRELNAQTCMMLDLLGDSLSSLGASSEIHARLDSYRVRLKDADKASKEEPETASDISSNVNDEIDVSLVPIVMTLFDVSTEERERQSTLVRVLCTEQAALNDFKTCLKSLNTDKSYPYCQADFQSAASWNKWRSHEVSSLSQSMLQMMQSNPELSQSSDRTSIGAVTSQLDRTRLNPSDTIFTYIPPDSKATYRTLLCRCLDSDLEVLRNLPEEEDVSLGILSSAHTSLLAECANRWRLPSSFRSTVFFSEILERFEKGEVPTACVEEAVGLTTKVGLEQALEDWPSIDVTLERRNLLYLQAVEEGLHYPEGYHSVEFADAVADYYSLDLSGPLADQDLRISLNLAEQIRTQAFTSYIGQASDRLDCEGSKNRSFAMHMATWVEREAKKLDRKFGRSITEHVDLVPLVLDQHLTLWFRDLEDTVLGWYNTEPRETTEESFALYRMALKLQEMGQAFLPDRDLSSRFPLGSLFGRLVNAWLDQTSVKTREWTDQALAIDKFEPSSPNGPSTSVMDLFESLGSAVTFLMVLRWPDEAELAIFANRLAKTISLTINEYCTKIERLFLEDMRQNETTLTVAKQRAWVEKARSTLASLQGERKIQAFFNFTSESCVKLNNIEAARQYLDKLYVQLRVDDLSAYDISQPVVQSRQRFLFTVKVVLAEGLAIDGSSSLPDSFVILSDEHGTRFAKTRTVYDETDPRWDETFDIPVTGSAWFMATVRHRGLAGKHDLLGRAYLRLDPAHFIDLLTKDILLPLDTRGHILLRVSMEGERDDIQYHFGRAFRWLKRTESEMVRILVDKTVNPLDYNEALGKLSAVYRSAVGSTDYGIPPTKEERRRSPSDSDIEAAIHPLFDYLDTNNHTLASTLSQDEMQMVMSKLWKQILMTIEALIVPPLSDKPSQLRALTDSELDVALKWLKFLRDFFYVGGDASGVPLSILQSAKFNEILSVRIYYDWSTDDLMEECIRGFQSTLKHRSTKPSKSLLSQRNLGTIRARKSAKRAAPSGSNTEIIMRILRMRQGTQEFLAQQLQTLSVVRLEDPKKAKRS
ncbi:hypothetical protein IAU60_001404 [Kwoniella sp. DSM 27419]